MSIEVSDVENYKIAIVESAIERPFLPSQYQAFIDLIDHHK